jgi:cytochrome P450
MPLRLAPSSRRSADRSADRSAGREAGRARLSIPQGLPPGPPQGRVTQTLMLHRDPLGTLERTRGQFGDVFTLRTATAGPIVFCCGRQAALTLPGLDHGCAHAGEARRQLLPQASTRSVFGADGDEHRRARATVTPAFVPERLDPLRPAMARLARRHVADWPRLRPFTLLPRVRFLLDDIFVRLVLGVRDETRARALTHAVGNMLRTPGNPPVTVPAPEDGLVGRVMDLVIRQRKAPVMALLEAEFAVRRTGPPADDVVGLLLAAEPDRSPADLADEILAVVMAAQEPPAAALTWMLLHLARHRKIAERLHAEGMETDFAAAVVRESLRVNPPALASLRRLTQAVSIDGHALPAGTVVAVPIPVVQRDPGRFPDPARLRPDRHLGPGRPGDDTMLPFGAGDRRCLAETLAQREFATIVPEVLAALHLHHAWPRMERMVLRATTLVPQRGGLVLATARAGAGDSA